jgi:sialate O-acetylesterase
MVKLPAIFSDGMVIEQQAKIWGTATPNEKITVVFRGNSWETRADAQGHFALEFAGGDFGRGFELTINDIVIKDVCVGYVWLCSGQSNMETPISRVRSMFAAELAEVNNPDIRAFIVPKSWIFNQSDKEAALDIDSRWQIAGGENFDDFYAVPYFFAKQLTARYGVPIGLICCAAGGASAESWLSPASVNKFPKYAEALAKWAAPGSAATAERQETENVQAWFNELDSLDLGVQEKWENNDTDVSAWSERFLTAPWDRDLRINGAVWFKKTVTVPAEMASEPAIIQLGVVIDSDYVYVNGVFVGRIEYRYPPSVFPIPAGVLKAGENTITVRALSHNGIGGFVAGKPYRIATENGEVSLTGVWKYRIGAVMRPAPDVTPFYHVPAGFYNGMLSHVLGYRITGAIWYQGETNAGYPDDYVTLMETLIAEWRGIWGYDFPFIFVQLANYEADSAPFPESMWARLREKQVECLAIPKTAMVVAADCGEGNDLHPQDKKTVGERLALAARAVAYGEDIVYSDPLAKAAEYDNEKIIVHFDFAESGLLTKDALYLEIESKTGGLFAAPAFTRGNTLVIPCPAAYQPASIRYAWADDPDAILYNTEGLPASPFRLQVPYSLTSP